MDSDGDTQEWFLLGAGHESSQSAASASYGNTGALTPDNWMISPAIDLTAAGASTTLEFWRKAQDQAWPSEKYSVYISTAGNAVADFTGADGATLIDAEVVVADGWQVRSLSLADYVGNTVYIAFRHHDCTDNFLLDIDDVLVFENNTVDAGITAMTAPSNDGGCSLTATENITVTIFNYGGNPISNFEVTYTIGENTVTETVTEAVAPSSSLDYTFTQQADLSALGFYNITAAVNVTGDEVADNNEFSKDVTNGDATLTVDVSTDSQGAQSWYVINSENGDTVASHGAYQWNLTNDITTVCLVNDGCYKFSWGYAGQGSNTVVLTYDGTEIYNAATTASFISVPFGSACAADDILLSRLTLQSTHVKDTPIQISGEVITSGASALNSFDVVYSVDGGAASAVYTASNLNATAGDTVSFTHNLPWTPAQVGSHTIEVTVSNPNGNADLNTNDNTQTMNVLVVEEAFQKTVVYEEGTGTWCGWCVRGHVGLKDMAYNHTDGSWIGIAVHNGDPMVVDEWNDGLANFISGYPSGAINRMPGEVDPGVTDLEAKYAEVSAMLPVAKVEATNSYNDDTREITVNADATFALDMTNANYNLSMLIVEDGVTGTGAGWDQNNYYAPGAIFPTGIDIIDHEGINWKDLGNPIPAADMVYNHVGRALVGGWNGVNGSVPASVTYNTPYSHQFTHTLPADQNVENIKVVVLLLDNATGEIVNATEAHLNVGFETINDSNLKVYPNPTTGLVKVDGVEGAQVVVYNMVGEVVYNEANASANTTIDLSSYNAGNYIVKVINNNEVSTQKITLTK